MVQKSGGALDSPPKRQVRRFSGAIHTPGLLRGVMDGSAEAAPENAAQHKRGRQKGYSRGADGRVLPDDRRFLLARAKLTPNECVYQIIAFSDGRSYGEPEQRNEWHDPRAATPTGADHP